MSTDLQTEVGAAKDRLRGLLRRVPDSVNNGGHQAAVRYKKLAVEGNKLLDSPRATLSKLQQCYSELATF